MLLRKGDVGTALLGKLAIHCFYKRLALVNKTTRESTTHCIVYQMMMVAYEEICLTMLWVYPIAPSNRIWIWNVNFLSYTLNTFRESLQNTTAWCREGWSRVCVCVCVCCVCVSWIIMEPNTSAPYMTGVFREFWHETGIVNVNQCVHCATKDRNE